MDEIYEKSSPSANLTMARPGFREPGAPSELYVRASAVVSRCVAGETLVLPVRGNIADLACFYSFNGTGTTIWEALEKPRNFEDLCDLIVHKYDVSRARAQEDVQSFLREICSLGLATAMVDSENMPLTEKSQSAGRNTALA